MRASGWLPRVWRSTGASRARPRAPRTTRCSTPRAPPSVRRNGTRGTHRGVWGLFRDVFVASGRFDEKLFRAAQGMQDLREAADYDALSVRPEEADAALADAERFVSAVAGLFRD
jgi:HEPN domain